MEAIIIILGLVTFLLLIVGVSLLVDGSAIPGFFIAALVTGVVAGLANWALVVRNSTPLYDGGTVTAISRSLKGDVTSYTITLDDRDTYACEDGVIKCGDIELGQTIIGQRWANNGWTWQFRADQRAAR